jgi:hypothetical protein
VKQFVHGAGGFFLAAIKPPSQQRQQTPGQGAGARRHFSLRKIRKALGLPQALLNPAGEVARREIEEIAEMAGVAQGAIDPVLAAIRISGMTHVRTSPNYPQSNGKLERGHKSLKSECLRPGTPLSLEDAKRLIRQYVDRYNNVRLHSAIGYVRPSDMLAGRQAEIHAERDRKLEAARQQRPESPPASCVKSEVASRPRCRISSGLPTIPDK